jgi:hypothetical protein
MAEAAIRKCKESWSCETLCDFGGGDRRYILQGAVGGWNTKKCDRFLMQVALYNKGLQRNGGKRYYQA